MKELREDKPRVVLTAIKGMAMVVQVFQNFHKSDMKQKHSKFDFFKLKLHHS